MPNWKKLLTSGSNIQISELTLDAAGVTKASIDTSGNLAAEGKISSSAALLGTEITLATNGTNKLVVSAAGAATFASTVTTTGLILGSTTVTSTGAELNILDGVTSTTAELNRLDGVTSTTAELNILDGVTADASELNALDGITSNVDELNVLDGITAVVGELNALDIGSTAVGTAVASKAVILDANKNFTGIGIKHTIGGNTGDVVYFGGTTSMTTGDIYHFKSDGTWEKANCNAAATSDGLLAVALGAASDTNGMLLRGMATLAEIDGTEAVGDVLYLSEDATGHANVAAPEGNGDIARVIGYCLHASNKTIWFNPDSTFVEITA